MIRHIGYFLIRKFGFSQNWEKVHIYLENWSMIYGRTDELTDGRTDMASKLRVPRQACED